MLATDNPGEGGEIPYGNTVIHQADDRTAIQRVLIVDDEEMILMVTKEMLHVLGFTAHTVSNLEEAQAAITEAQENQTPFDAAIIDLILSGNHTGESVNHLLKSIAPSLATVASSGKRHHPALDEPTDYGFNASLTKPYSLRDIELVMKAL